MASAENVELSVAIDANDTKAVLDSINNNIKKIADNSKTTATGTNNAFNQMGAAIAKVGAAVVSVRAVFGFLKDSVKEAIDAAKSQVVLENALKNVGLRYKDIKDDVERIAEMNAIDDDDVKKIYSYATSLGVPTERLSEFVELAYDFSAATGKDISMAMRTLTDDAIKGGDAWKQLRDRFKGAGQAAADADGGLQRLQTKFKSIQEQIGQKLIPIITEIAKAFLWVLNQVGPVIERLSQNIEALSYQFLDFQTKITKSGAAGANQVKQYAETLSLAQSSINKMLANKNINTNDQIKLLDKYKEQVADILVEIGSVGSKQELMNMTDGEAVSRKLGDAINYLNGEVKTNTGSVKLQTTTINEYTSAVNGATNAVNGLANAGRLQENVSYDRGSYENKKNTKTPLSKTGKSGNFLGAGYAEVTENVEESVNAQEKFNSALQIGTAIMKQMRNESKSVADMQQKMASSMDNIIGSLASGNYVGAIAAIVQFLGSWVDGLKLALNIDNQLAKTHQQILNESYALTKELGLQNDQATAYAAQMHMGNEEIKKQIELIRLKNASQQESIDAENAWKRQLDEQVAVQKHMLNMEERTIGDYYAFLVQYLDNIKKYKLGSEAEIRAVEEELFAIEKEAAQKVKEQAAEALELEKEKLSIIKQQAQEQMDLAQKLGLFDSENWYDVAKASSKLTAAGYSGADTVNSLLSSGVDASTLGASVGKNIAIGTIINNISGANPNVALDSAYKTIGRSF